MSLEVEQKFRVDDLDALLRRLADESINLGEAVTQRDDYFNHPAKDFKQTDEALRIRCLGDENRVTYKGPKQSSRTKTRRELEFGIAPGERGREQFRDLLLALEFRPVRTVEKQRRTAALEWDGVHVELAVDRVEGLGNFAELEATSEDDDFQAAEQAVLALAEKLELSDVVRRSYLEMLLADDS